MQMLGLREACAVIVGFFEVTCKLFKFVIECSNAIGYVIVRIGVSFMKWFLHLVATVTFAARVLYEDGLIFLADVSNKLSYIVSGISDFMFTSFSVIWNVWDNLKYISISTFQFLTSTYNMFCIHSSRIFKMICNIPDTVKQIVILIGNGIWLALQIIPLAFVYVSSMTVFLIGRSFEELSTLANETARVIFQTIGTVTSFVSDIPTESLIGLAVGICTVLLCIKYRYKVSSSIIIVFMFLHRKIEHVLHGIWTCLENMILNLVNPRGHDIANIPVIEAAESETDDSTASEASAVDNNVNVEEFRFHEHKTSVISRRSLHLKLMEEQENKLCVVCQDRGKNVILFPCRHVCLCSVCSDVIKNRHGTCPVCREHVSRTMKVYL